MTLDKKLLQQTDPGVLSEAPVLSVVDDSLQDLPGIGHTRNNQG